MTKTAEQTQQAREWLTSIGFIETEHAEGWESYELADSTHWVRVIHSKFGRIYVYADFGDWRERVFEYADDWQDYLDVLVRQVRLADGGFTLPDEFGIQTSLTNPVCRIQASVGYSPVCIQPRVNALDGGWVLWPSPNLAWARGK